MGALELGAGELHEQWHHEEEEEHENEKDWRTAEKKDPAGEEEQEEEEVEGCASHRSPTVLNLGEGLEGLKALEQGGNVDDSPVEQVRYTDDPSLLVWTFRMWTIGLLFCF